jgi:outer membrane beta-barrel protein
MSRTTKTTVRVLASALLVAAGLASGAKEASAQEIQLTGPLANAPAGRNLRLYREGRIEIAPSFTSTILDEFRRTLLVGARVNYGITDWLSVGVWGGYGAVGISTGLSDRIDEGALRSRDNPSLTLMNVSGSPGGGRFQKQVGQINWMLMPQITAVPFRGKFALFQGLFADVDAYVFAGFGLVATKERAACNSFVECANRDGAGAANGVDRDPLMESKSRPAPTWGLGFNFYLSRMIALGVEWRMIPFSWNRSGFDSRGQNAQGVPESGGNFPDQRIDAQDATLRFNQMMSIYLGFSFPTMPKITD